MAQEYWQPSTQPPSIETILTTLLNEISAIPERLILILDDYHSIDSQPVDQALAFLLEHLPPQVHLVVATREDPPLPLAHLRARGQLTELRAARPALHPPRGRRLSEPDDGTEPERGRHPRPGSPHGRLDRRSAAGRPLDPGSSKTPPDLSRPSPAAIDLCWTIWSKKCFRSSPKASRLFCLRTSILDRLCGSLCDAVLRDPAISGQEAGQGTGQETLEYLDHGNLFIVPLDNERRGWYRYHHLFGDILFQRLGQRFYRIDRNCRIPSSRQSVV